MVVPETLFIRRNLFLLMMGKTSLRMRFSPFFYLKNETGRY